MCGLLKMLLAFDYCTHQKTQTPFKCIAICCDTHTHTHQLVPRRRIHSYNRVNNLRDTSADEGVPSFTVL